MSMQSYQVMVYGVYLEDSPKKIEQVFGENAWGDDLNLPGGKVEVVFEMEAGKGSGVGFAIKPGMTLKQIQDGFAAAEKALKSHPLFAELEISLLQIDQYY